MEPTEATGGTPSGVGRGIGRFVRPRYLIGGGVMSAGIAAAVVAVVFVGNGDGSGTNSGELLEAPVTLGDLVDSVSSDGSIVFPERSVMSFGSAGTVDEVLVSVGDTVIQGQVLAKLDPLTTSNLSADVAEARTALEDANDKLKDVINGTSALVIAQAQAAVNSAQASVNALLAQPDREILDARAAVTKTEIALADALKDLTDLESRQDSQAFADAQVDLALAIDSYEGALAELAVVERDQTTAVLDAATALEDMRAAYIEEFGGWFGVILTDEQITRPPSEILADWDATYESIFVRNPSASIGTDPDDPATPWNELTVSLWTRVYPFGVNATCDSPPASGESPCVQLEIEDAWSAIQTAEDAIGTAAAARAGAITAARKAITVAETAVDSAEDNAAAVTALDLRAAAENIAIAEGNFSGATVALEALENPAAGGIDVASTSLAIAQAELSDSRDHLLDVTDSNETLIALRTSEVEVAKAELDRAVALFESAVLKSPVDGIVDAVNFEAGDEVQRIAAIVEIIDPTVVTVEMDVAQIDILAVTVGAEASLTLDALPGQTLSGTVTDIGAASGGQTGTITFPVVVTMQVPLGITLLEGLTANAQMITNMTSNVLLVPSVAVGGSFTQPTVDVLRNGEVQSVPVSLGGGNETFAVISAGVVEGETVLFRLPGVTEETNPFSVLRAGVGGGFGGGATFGGGGRGAGGGATFGGGAGGRQ
ncbi:MAG: efflux RND transporter periplasmic adaptor subunit [Chloroflexi bacterium]|nr:efflux RND transporter periplasmic adaptor subunit [Chloroflexota bacterium]